MVDIDRAPGAIEGLEILVAGQNIRVGARPLKLDSNGLFYPVNVNTRGEGTIVQERNPKRPKFCSHAHLDTGDRVKGPYLWGGSSDPIGPPSIGGAGRTSAHTGQTLSVTGDCLMKIVKGWRGNVLPAHPRETLTRIP